MTTTNVIFAAYGIPCVVLYALTLVSIVSIRKQLSATFVAIYVLTSAMVRCSERLLLFPISPNIDFDRLNSDSFE